MKLVAQILATFNEIDSHLTKIYDIAINANDSAAQQAIADKRVLTENAFFVLLWGQLENEINETPLAAIGKRRRMAATTPRFTTVAFHVLAAPVITTMVDALALGFAAQLGLATSPVPVPLDAATISMVWHSSYDHDPAHRWLREVMVRLGREAVQDQADAL